jgi:hypothetical protein
LATLQISREASTLSFSRTVLQEFREHGPLRNGLQIRDIRWKLEEGKRPRLYAMNAKLNGKLRVLEREPRHQCLIYDGPPSKQLPAMAAVIKRMLDGGHRCLYLNSRPMVAGIKSCLASIGVDVVSEVAKARLVLSSESFTSVKGDFDIDVMLHKLEDALDQALKDGYIGLWASGDMTWELGSEKNFPKLMEYEHRLEELFCKRPELCGICQYHQDTLPREVTRGALLTHRMIFVNETLSRINPHYVPSALANEPMASNLDLDKMLTALRQLQSAKA